MERLLISVEEAAEMLGVGRSTVYDLMRVGKIPSVRIRRCRRVPVDGLRAYIAGEQSRGWLELKRGA